MLLLLAIQNGAVFWKKTAHSLHALVYSWVLTRSCGRAVRPLTAEQARHLPLCHLTFSFSYTLRCDLSSLPTYQTEFHRGKLSSWFPFGRMSHHSGPGPGRIVEGFQGIEVLQMAGRNHRSWVQDCGTAYQSLLLTLPDLHNYFHLHSKCILFS